MAHVAEWKKEEVNELKSLIDKYDVIGIVDLLNIPAKQLQEMRKSLHNKAVIRMSKKNLIDLALEDCNASKNNIVDLSEHMEGQVAVIATEMNPFKLYKILEDSKTSAPAKPGAIATDILLYLKETQVLNQVHSSVNYNKLEFQLKLIKVKLLFLKKPFL